MDLKQQRQADILAAACRVFRRRGFHQAQMAEIAREAGTSYGLVYHYYKNKADLFDTILNQWWDGLYSILSEKLNENNGIEEKCRVIIDYFLDRYEQTPDVVHVFITEASRSTANLNEQRLDAFKKWIGFTEKVFAGAQDSGQLRTDIKARYLSTFFLGSLETMLSTLVLNNQQLKGQAQRQRVTKNLLEHFFTGAMPREKT